ncbi:MAG: sn-glycerol-1-phosphate dehydrogenase [Tidjanibacter sp.]|nr:sn-glycerol-1-phosphate dehydrogenase [Tidjanibacter sp.]
MSNQDRIEKALSVANQTKALAVGPNIIGDVGAMFKEQFPGRKAIIISNDSTYEKVGVMVAEALTAAGVEQDEPFIFTDPNLYAEFTYVLQLDACLSRTRAIPIAVGAGTINDLTKICSYRNGKRYMCVATAASMDGYAAYGASITYNGEKKDFECPAPKAILADTAIIAQAPSSLTAAGYADLFAKITAGADWILADELGVEHIDPFYWSIIQDGLIHSLKDPKGIQQGDLDAIEPLVEGLVLGGFAMQGLRSSRPASGAEHQFSHLWDMEKHTFEGYTPSHGFKVSIGMLAVTALYEQMLHTDFSNFDVEAAVEAWPEAEDQAQEVRQMFGDTDFMSIAVTETMAKHISRRLLRRQLTMLKLKWPEIRERLGKQLIPFAEVSRRLALVGAPTMPRQIGITRTRLRESFHRAVCIRRRFTILDVALRTNMLDTWLDNIFGPGGIWEIGDIQ